MPKFAVRRALTVVLLVCGTLAAGAGAAVCPGAVASPRPAASAASASSESATVKMTTTSTSSPTASHFYISGGGFGHGVGMSQYGAAGFALHGYSYGQILAHYYLGTTLGRLEPNRTVTVLLHEGAAIFRGATAIVGSPKKLNAALNYGVFRHGSKLRITVGHRLVGIFPAPLIVHDKGGLHGTGLPLILDGQGAYNGVFVFRPNGDHGVMTVNSVGVDDYVRGVVTSEMPSRWPTQALEAQAIAARTYVIAAPAATPDFDVYDNTLSQVYGGVKAESPTGNAAVSATAGKVVEFDGRPVVTYFSSSSGGHTESVQNVWYGLAPRPWLVGVPDPYDDSYGNPDYRWLRSYTLPAASRKVSELYKGAFVGIKITQTGVSPRVVRALVVGSQSAGAVTGVALQHLFGTLSTYMAFTTLTEKGVRTRTVLTTTKPAKHPVTTTRSTTKASTITRKITFQYSVIGTVYPAERGLRLTAQRWEATGWHTVSRTRLAADGTYVIPVRAPGTYRVVDQTLDGPNVRVP